MYLENGPHKTEKLKFGQNRFNLVQFGKIWEVIDLHITLICNSLFLRLLSGCEFGVTVSF